MDIKLLLIIDFAVMLILGASFLIPQKNTGKSLLKRVVGNGQSKLFLGEMHPIARYLDNLSGQSIFKVFNLKEEDKDYIKYKKQITAAGGLGGLTPGAFNLTKILAPIVIFVMLMVYSTFAQSSKDYLNPNDVQDVVQQFNSQGGIIKVKAENGSGQSGGLNNLTIIGAVSMAGYFLPNFFLKRAVKVRKQKLEKEQPVIETFTLLMLETNSITVIDLLKTLKQTTVMFRPYLEACINEYNLDPKKAIQTMADRVNLESFQVVCNGLKQAVDMEKTQTAMLMREHLEQIQKLQDLRREAEIKKKPMRYVFLLAIPLVSIMVIWMYPWFIKAMRLLSTGF